MSRWLRRMWSGREAKAPGGQEGATEKRRWSFWRPRECLPSAAARLNPATACWVKFSSDEDEDEQSQRAAAGLLIADGHGTLRAAAVVIQTAFRGFLARKALKALKALIKLQALARGHLIRKQAVTTLRRMEALARAQATTIRARRSLQRLSSSFDSSTKIVEIDLNAYHTTRRSPALGIMDDSQLLAFHSPVPRRIAIPNRKNYHQENDCECWYAENTKGRLPATAHNTPKYTNVYGNGGGFVRVKSVASSPKFMASTQSSMAKRWSCQGRIEEPRRRQPLSEVNSCCHVEEEGFSFKSVVVGRLERPSLEHLVRKN